MALIEQEPPYYAVSTPLSYPDEQEQWLDVEPIVLVDPMQQVQRRMVLILVAVIAFVFGFGFVVTQGIGSSPDGAAVAENGAPENAPAVAADAVATEGTGGGGISPLFTREIQHWAPAIVAWSNEFGLDPNMAATIMQIESCGDPNAVSIAGAQGLFQVMPFHFVAGENMQDPNTNARKGLNYFSERLVQTQGDVGRAFAGYNGGHVAAGNTWDQWAAETQRYYTWSTGIYADAAAGNTTSATLDQWLAAGGAGLCRQASQRLGLP